MMLRGKALQDRARELDIPGRSKMTADELRDAVVMREQEIANPGDGDLARDFEDLSEPEVSPITRMAETAKRLQAESMDNTRRFDIYERQNGIRMLTHRQRRRMRKHERKAMGR